MITIVDYGLGNITAFKNIYNQLNVPVKIAKTEADLEDTSKIILPGVGSFDWAIKRLNKSGMRGKIEDLVVNQRIPILGVCVGMQIMAEESDEGAEKGLAWIQAKVKSLNSQIISIKKNLDLPIPHMGWNKIELNYNSLLFKDIKELEYYFLHSYFLLPSNSEITISSTKYILNFTSAFQQANIYGVQFHPEKSHASGKKLLKNFASI